MTKIILFELFRFLLLRTALSVNVSKMVDVTMAELSRHNRATQLDRGSSGKRFLMHSGHTYETLDNGLTKMIPVASDVLSSPRFDGNGTFVNAKHSVCPAAPLYLNSTCNILLSIKC
jgi:hypothetical protein